MLPAACVSQSDRLLRSYLLITSDYTLKTRSSYDREIKIETWKRAEIPGLTLHLMDGKTEVEEGKATCLKSPFYFTADLEFNRFPAS